MIATELNPRQVIRRMRANLGDLGNNAKARQVRLVTATLRAEGSVRPAAIRPVGLASPARVPDR